jgi:hypothetical protein
VAPYARCVSSVVLIRLEVAPGVGGERGAAVLSTGGGLVTDFTPLVTREDVSGATPDSPLIFNFSFGPTTPGSFLSCTPAPLFGGEFCSFGPFIVLGTQIADFAGHAAMVQQIPASVVASGRNGAWQVFDLAAFSFGTPAAMQFHVFP